MRCSSPRLRFVPFAPALAPRVWSLWNDPAVGRYLFDGQPVSRKHVDDWIATSTRTTATHGHGLCLLESAQTGDELGFAGLVHLLDVGELEFVAGLWPQAWGQGLATEGAKASMQYGFERMGFEQIVAVVHPGNTASHRVIEKLGMSFVEETQYFGMQVFRYVSKAFT